MWEPDEVAIEISAVDRDVMLVAVSTPAGRFELLGAVSVRAGILMVEEAHIQGLHPGAIGRRGINVIARMMMVEADVRGLVVEGSARTTGRTPGRRQRPFRFPHPPAPEAGG